MKSKKKVKLRHKWKHSYGGVAHGGSSTCELCGMKMKVINGPNGGAVIEYGRKGSILPHTKLTPPCVGEL